MILDPFEIETVFLRAMATGWTEDGNERIIPDLPTAKGIPFTLGDFQVLDYYFVSPGSDKSAGTTTIWYKGVPVWVMNYGGEYAKDAIPFLKSCLNRAYVDEYRFYGGRGPAFVRGERFTYVNQIERGNFIDFVGEERIFDLSEVCFGYHWYRGMTLF